MPSQRGPRSKRYGGTEDNISAAVLFPMAPSDGGPPPRQPTISAERRQLQLVPAGKLPRSHGEHRAANDAAQGVGLNSRLFTALSGAVLQQLLVPVFALSVGRRSQGSTTTPARPTFETIRRKGGQRQFRRSIPNGPVRWWSSAAAANDQRGMESTSTNNGRKTLPRSTVLDSPFEPPKLRQRR